MESQPQQIQVRASDQDLKGVYSNMMQITHTQEEFILDFFNIIPGGTAGVLAARVILSPGHMKRMIAAAAGNLKNYEDKFGSIFPSEAPPQQFGFKV